MLRRTGLVTDLVVQAAGALGLEHAVLVQHLHRLQDEEAERHQWIDGGPEHTQETVETERDEVPFGCGGTSEGVQKGAKWARVASQITGWLWIGGASRRAACWMVRRARTAARLRMG